MRILTAKNEKSCSKCVDSEKSRLSPPTAVARVSGKPEIGRSRSTTRFQHESDTPGVVPWDIRIGLNAAVTCRSHVFVPNSICHIFQFGPQMSGRSEVESSVLCRTRKMSSLCVCPTEAE